ncbi:MAG: mandelate racemase/muconate lactonizing enzyme family protein [Sedimentisphaerales bacterium]|nr:mandelate racemase/muconate lactonizing enzyme family protein [Sedimentisphaerales bacterium]
MNRRQFIKASTVAAGIVTTSGVWLCAAPQVKIAKIDIFPMRYPMMGYFKFFTGPHGGTGRAAIIVKITADNGVIGWGQSVPIAKWSYETLETATIALRDYYAPALVGSDPFDIPGAHRIMDGVIASGFSTGMPITRAGVDIALHDLVGKLTGRSLARLWNLPQGKNITMNWTLNGRTLEEIERVMEVGINRGYDSFIIKVAPDPTFDMELVRMVRKHAPKGFLWADANGGYDPKTALDVAPKLADLGLSALESPLKPNQIGGYQALKRQGALPILMDEGVVSPTDLEEFIRLKMLDGVAMKPSRCGGLMSSKRQIELIRENGLMWLGSGLTDPDISLAATLGLYGAFDLKSPAALNGLQFLTANVLAKPFRIEGNTIDVPDGPGLGIEVDEHKVIELMKQTK